MINPLRQVVHIRFASERRWDLLLECGHEVTRYMMPSEHVLMGLVFGRITPEHLGAPKRCRCVLCGQGATPASDGYVLLRIRQREEQGQVA